MPIMKPVSLDVAFRPLLFVCFIAGVYTMHVQPGRRALAVLKRMLNLCFPLLSCFILSLGVIDSINGILTHKKESGENNIASMYFTSVLIGELYLVVVLSTVGSRSLRRFFRLFRSHCNRFERNNRHFGFVLRLGIAAVCIAVVNQFQSAYRMYGAMTTPCTVDMTSYLWLVFAAKCLPPVVYFTTHFISHVFSVAFTLHTCVWRILFNEASDLVKLMKDSKKTDFLVSPSEPQQVSVAWTKQITLTGGPDVLEHFRLRHGELCDLITSANKCLRHIMAAILGSGVPCILFVLHGFVYEQLDRSSFANMAMMFVSLVSCIVGIMLTGIALHLKMHQPTDLLYQLNIENMTGKGANVVATFLSRLQGPPIGFNVYHLFTIDTSTILMVCGTILTYAVVIIQFQPTGEGQGIKPETHIPTQTSPSVLDVDTATTFDTLTMMYNDTVM